ncbi:periplasmic heavy metal sensor [Burkholderia sp. 3C]
MNGRTGTVVLIVSIVLNVFLLGAIAGGAYQWFARHPGGSAAVKPGAKIALRFAADGLPPERAEQFREALASARRESRIFVREAREGRRDVLDLLAAPQVDRPAVDEALARTRQADSYLRAQVESNVVDFAQSLPPDERQRFVDGLRRSGQWRMPAARNGKPSPE